MFQRCVWKQDMYDTQVLFHFDLSLIFSIVALTRILDGKAEMIFSNIEEITLDTFFYIPYYIESL